jgi:hypothetical protein
VSVEDGIESATANASNHKAIFHRFAGALIKGEPRLDDHDWRRLVREHHARSADSYTA